MNIHEAVVVANRCIYIL